MEETSLVGLLISWLPLLLYLAVMVFMVRKMAHINRNIERIAKALEERAAIRN